MILQQSQKPTKNAASVWTFRPDQHPPFCRSPESIGRDTLHDAAEAPHDMDVSPTENAVTTPRPNLAQPQPTIVVHIDRLDVSANLNQRAGLFEPPHIEDDEVAMDVDEENHCQPCLPAAAASFLLAINEPGSFLTDTAGLRMCKPLPKRRLCPSIRTKEIVCS